MKRIFLFVICLAFSTSSLLAEDWLSLFHGLTAGVVDQRLTAEQKYEVVIDRLTTEDSNAAQKETTELAAVYDQHPEVRLLMDFFVHDVAYGRLAAFGGTTDAFLRPLQPIVPILIAHLFDGDEKATQATMGVFPFLADLQTPPVGIMQPWIYISRDENEELQKRIVRIARPVAPHRDGDVIGWITISKTGTVTDIHFSDGENNLQSAVRKAVRGWSFRPSEYAVTAIFTVTFRNRRGSYTLL
jgi:hypothetical protein